MKLTKDTYFTPQANAAYMSVSQFKQFRDCEACALAEIKGECSRPKSKAFLEGGYVDAHFSGELSEYLDAHPEILNKRSGELKAEFVKARAAIEAAEADQMFMSFLDGERQTILTGELFGAPWKAKPDFVLPDKIVDLKYMRDMLPVWVGNEKKTFIDAYGYDIQGYVYRQLVYQNTGKMLPFYLAVITKEEPSARSIVEIPEWKMNSVEAVLEHYSERYWSIKRGEIEPERCERCSYCRGTMKVEHVTSYEELLQAI